MNDLTPPQVSENLLRHLRPGFLDGAPIKPLGVYGGYLFVEDASGERHALRPDDFTPLRIASFFGPHVAWLAKLWPRAPIAAKWQTRPWNAELAAESLIAACSHAGIVDPEHLGFALGRRRNREINYGRR